MSGPGSLGLPRVEVGWSPDRAAAVERVLVRRHRQRRHLRRAGAMALSVLVVCGAYWGWPRRQPATGAPAMMATAPVSPGAGERVRRLADGSTVTLLCEGADVRTVVDAPGQVRLELLRGTARFSVVRRPERVFQVVVGQVQVAVIGTEFTIERKVDGARVQVHRGRVRVSGFGSVRELEAGEHAELVGGAAVAAPGQVEAAPQPMPAPVLDEAVKTPPPRRERPARARANPVPEGPARPAIAEWRRLAEAGEFDAAYGLLDGRFGQLGGAADLLLAADVARLTRHPERAVSLLRRVLASHQGDARAPLAAFTLGRVLLEELGRPQEAAPVFATARSLATQGPLAEDALAREVEAWSRAGELSRARERAAQYVQEYPSGRRIRAVRRHGGLE